MKKIILSCIVICISFCNLKDLKASNNSDLFDIKKNSIELTKITVEKDFNSYFNSGSSTYIEIPISDGIDDGEEYQDGTVSLYNSDIELVNDGATKGNQTVGLRFTNVQIPKDAIIESAVLQFACDETKDNSANLIIQCEATANSSGLSGNPYNISLRQKTESHILWQPEGWNTPHDLYNTPDLSAIIQDIVNQAEWQLDNALTIIITGNGKRTAESFEGASGDLSYVPTLKIQFRQGNDIENPIAPSNLSADVISSSQINLSWDDNTQNEEGFIVERSTDSENYYIAIDTLPPNTTAFNDINLLGESQYYYRVTAINPGEYYLTSNIISATTLSNLIAYYSFTGNVFDSNDYSNHGIAHEAILTTDRFENENSAYEFDGNDDYIELPVNLDKEVEQSISFWFKANEIPIFDYTNNPSDSWGALFSYDNGNLQNGSTRIGVSNIEGTDKVWVFRGGMDSEVNPTLLSKEIEKELWYHLTVTINSDSTKMYLDGDWVGSYRTTNEHSSDGNSSIIVGAGRKTDRRFFNGKIDDIKVFNEAIPQIKIAELFGDYNNNIPSQQFPFGGVPWPIPGIIDSKNFDEGGEGVAYHDLTIGGSYLRPNEDPDIDALDGTGSIVFMDAGEWMEYTIDIQKQGNYDVKIICSSGGAQLGKPFRFLIDNKEIFSIYSVWYGGYQGGTHEHIIENVALNEGIYVLRVECQYGQEYFDKIIFTEPTIPNAPNIPARLVTTPISSSQIDLTWIDNSNNEDGFIIRRYDSSGWGYEMIDTVPRNTMYYSDKNLRSSEIYKYDIIAFNNVGNSKYPSYRQQTTTFSSPLQKPVGDTLFPVPGTVYAKNYDEAGVFDDLTNGGASYVTEDIDFDYTKKGPGLCVVIDSGVWLEYTLNIKESGEYDFNLISSSVRNNTDSIFSLQVLIDNEELFTIYPKQLGIFTIHENIERRINLEKGECVLKVKCYNGPLVLNRILITNKIPEITSPLISQGQVGAEYSYQIEAINAPFDYQARNLPSGLNLHRYDGIISGTPRVEGDYKVILETSNFLGASTDTLHLKIEREGLQHELTIPIISGTNDVEMHADETLDFYNGDLELVNDGAKGSQIVGLRFEDIHIPTDAIIESAKIQFTCDEVKTGPTDLVIEMLHTICYDSRPISSGFNFLINEVNYSPFKVDWQPEEWIEVGKKYYTPDLSSMIQQTRDTYSRFCFNQDKMSLTFVISGTGRRNAISYEGAAGDLSLVPTLQIQYRLDVKEKPIAPSDPVVNVISSSQIHLSWIDNSDNEAGFIIERSTSSQGEFNNIDTVRNTNHYNSVNLAENTTYYYRVAAFNGLGNSEYSNTVNAKTLAEQKPYGGTPWPVPGTIEVEDYDEGGEGIAYHDMTPMDTNYRNDAVDLATHYDYGEYDKPYFGVDMTNMEWLEYSIYVEEDGEYDFYITGLTFASGNRSLDVFIDDKEIFSIIPEYYDWRTPISGVGVDFIYLPKGEHILRINCLMYETGFTFVDKVQIYNSIKPQVISPLTSVGQVNKPYEYQIEGKNNPTFFTAQGLPLGLEYDYLSGLISGIPEEKGDFDVILYVSNISGGTYDTLQLKIIEEELLHELTVPITSGSNDVEEYANGNMDFYNGDLELVYDGSKGNQTVGLRFENLAIPQGATIHSATIQFACDETKSAGAFLDIYIEDVANSNPFSYSKYDVSSRIKSMEKVIWHAEEWTKVGDIYNTPDLSLLVQNIINNQEWEQNNAISFIINGLGKRTAVSFEGARENLSLVPNLKITYDISQVSEKKGISTLAENYSIKDVNLFPNPLNGNSLNVELPEELLPCEIGVYTVEGMMIKKITGVNSSNTVINIPDIGQNIFLINIKNKNESITRKILRF